jgi:hypothetical protein
VNVKTTLTTTTTTKIEYAFDDAVTTSSIGDLHKTYIDQSFWNGSIKSKNRHNTVYILNLYIVMLMNDNTHKEYCQMKQQGAGYGPNREALDFFRLLVQKVSTREYITGLRLLGSRRKLLLRLAAYQTNRSLKIRRTGGRADERPRGGSLAQSVWYKSLLVVVVE